MAIDNPIEAFEKQYMKDNEPLFANKLAKFMGDTGSKLAFPDGGLALEIMLKVADVLFNKDSGRARIREMFDLFKDEFKHIESTKASHEDVQKAIQIATWNDWRDRDDEKRQRYVSLIGNALRSASQIQDVTSFIQTLEHLNERDLLALKVLNKVMNRESDWRSPTSSHDTWKVHPNVFSQRAQDLSFQIALALGQRVETNLYSREIGYGICARLQGFGLAHEVETETRELPLTSYAFRPSTHGLVLLKLLGENVPNLEHYSFG
jgi:hypothetical protein